MHTSYIATACVGITWTDDEPTNGFTADCTSAVAHGDTCVITVSVGYAGGSVTCDTADGLYDVVVATGMYFTFPLDRLSLLTLFADSLC